ncbi:MAG: hypothetical protein JWP97_2653 [Labilithrix sp.]|nr:hypothetical protein [Labilithrix sp.]
MTSSSRYPDDVLLVELHDAIVERFEMTRKGDARIELAHLAVYLRETGETCGVWSFRAELSFVGLESFDLHGSPPRDEADSVFECELRGSDGAFIDPAALLRDVACELGTAHMTWALSDATITLRGGAVSLRLLERLERVETWTGPLA